MKTVNTKFTRQLLSTIGLYRPIRAIYRHFEHRQEVAFYSKLLEPDSLCFDVGANVGKKTFAMLEAGMRVVAFEPQPDCIYDLKMKCMDYLNKLIDCECAVGAEVGESTLYINSVHSHSSLKQNWLNEVTVNEIQVSVITLDRAIEDYGRPDYCKIDVEGWEYEVLKGLTQPIPLLSFEYHLSQKEVGKALVCLDYLSRFGDLRINLRAQGRAMFAYEDWLTLQEFLRLFPDAFRSRKGYSYGNIFVRTDNYQLYQ
jgi:FkbM family methyltransferase